jgi:hypothetical protein
MRLLRSATRRRRALLLTAAVLFLAMISGAWRLSAARRIIDFESRDPFWIASIEGTPGDRAHLWIWTPGPMRLTEVPVPSVIRLSRSHLLLQVKSAAQHAVRLQVRRGRGDGAVEASTEEGSSNSVVFVSSVHRIPFLGDDAFSIHPFSAYVPLGLRPLYSPPWDRYHSSYDLVEPLPAPSP